MSLPATLPLERQTELRALRAANEAAERPPYAWVKLTRDDLLWLISEHGWVVGDEPGPRVDLRAANLVGADLHELSLRQARFENAVLVGADLREADCFFAHFTEADLRRTQWEGAQLAMARMRGARLAEAQMPGVNLRQCWLPEADLTAANLDGSDLSLAQMERVDLHEASLVGAQLVGARMPDSDLRAAKLAKANLASAHLERSQLDAADLRNASLVGAWCDAAAWYGADLRKADLRGARFTGAQLGGATLAGARLGLIDLVGVDLTRLADLTVLTTQPTGDEMAAHAQTDPAQRVIALQAASDGLLRLRAALAVTQAVDSATLRRLRQRARALGRQAQRHVPRGTWQALGQTIAYLFLGDGDAPGRVGLWALGLLAAITALLTFTGMAPDVTTALTLAASGFTTAGIGYFAAHTSGGGALIGIVESVIGDLLLACFIAAVVRRNLD